MNYLGIECPVCGEKFNEQDDVVVCPVCGTPHHRACWKNNGGCKNAEKHNDGFVWQNPNAPTAAEPVGKQSSEFKICPRCGEKNALYEPVCTRCGERLKANRQTIHDIMPPFSMNPNQNPQDGDWNTAPNPNNFSPYQNMYAADARAVFGDDAKIEDISVTEIAEYIQKDSNKYIGKFLAMEEKHTKLSWNWSAGICSVFWFFYRKMMGMGFILMTIICAVIMASSIVPGMIYEKYNPEVCKQYEQDLTEVINMGSSIMDGGGISDRSELSEFYGKYFKVMLSPISVTSYIMTGALLLLVNIIFGFFGNYLYKRKILKDIRSIRQVAADSMSYHMYIRQRGGVSAIQAVFPILIYMMFYFFRMMV